MKRDAFKLFSFAGSNLENPNSPYYVHSSELRTQQPAARFCLTHKTKISILRPTKSDFLSTQPTNSTRFQLRGKRGCLPRQSGENPGHDNLKVWAWGASKNIEQQVAGNAAFSLICQDHRSDTPILYNTLFALKNVNIALFQGSF